LESSINQFIASNKAEIDSLAAEDLWGEINQILTDNFPDEDPNDVISIFNQLYGTPVKESDDDEDPKYDHRSVKNVAGMAYTSQSKSTLGVNQKLTESQLIRRIEDF
jgi:hypothetical protein